MAATTVTAHPVVAWPFYEAGRKLGLPVDAGLQGFGIGEGGATDARIGHAQANELLWWGVELSGRPDFGLLAAQSVEPGHFDLVELASRSQRTVGDAIGTLSSLTAILHDSIVVALERGAQTSTLRVSLRDGLALHPAGYDFIAASLLIGARRQTGVHAVGMLGLCMPYPRPQDVGYLQAFFDTELRFDAEALEIRFATSALDRPLLRSNAQAGRVLEQAARELLPQPSTPHYTPRVAQALRAQLGRGEGTLAAVARALAVSERTLRRRLQDEGQSFRAVLDDVRRQMAFDALDDPARSTEAIASELGFTTAQAFHRAFRRWTGDTVQAHRSRGKGR